MAINPISSFNQEQFLQLFLAQLQNQNPLDPVSDRDLIGQLTQVSTLDGIQRLNTSFADLLRLQQLTQGSDLVGKTVSFEVPGSSQPGRGVVSAVNVDGGSLVLRVGEQSIPLSRVKSVEATP
jgi:flagellar basal-body rod modification protein FlgD